LASSRFLIGETTVDLQVFVSEALKQLIAAVKTAQESARQLGGRVVPDGVDGERKARSGQAITDVEFDVAVTVAEGSEKKGGLGVAIAALAIGGTAQASTTNSTVSRIKFRIPVAWPLD
jgi:hypothetical protein